MDDGAGIPRPIGEKCWARSAAVKHGEVGRYGKKREKIAVVRSQRIAWLGHVTGIRERERERCTAADKDRPDPSILKSFTNWPTLERQNSKRALVANLSRVSYSMERQILFFSRVSQILYLLDKVSIVD